MSFTETALAEMLWHRITPPEVNGGKTTCPHCSASREKSGEKCLRVKEYDDGLVFHCYHCEWEN